MPAKGLVPDVSPCIFGDMFSQKVYLKPHPLYLSGKIDIRHVDMLRFRPVAIELFEQLAAGRINDTILVCEVFPS